MDGLSLSKADHFLGCGHSSLFAGIVNTGISHTSGYQSALLSDTLPLLDEGLPFCLWSANCCWSTFHGSSGHMRSYHWKINTLPISWLTPSAGGVICQCLGQQKFAVTENQLWWWVCECGVGVAGSPAKQEWSFHGMKHPLLTLLRMAGYWWHCCLRNAVLTELHLEFHWLC